MLAHVSDWKGLAGWLSVDTIPIEEDCALQTNSRAMCYRRELVQRYCDRQLSGPSKVAESIATALEKMHHNRQAEELRQRKSRLNAKQK